MATKFRSKKFVDVVNKILFIFACSALFCIVLALTLLVILAIPHWNIESFPTVKVIVSIPKEIAVPVGAVVTLVVTAMIGVGIFSKMFKRDAMIKISLVLIVSVLFCSLPFMVSFASVPIIEHYDDEYAIFLKNLELENNAVPEDEEEEADAFALNISFDDVMFSEYSLKEIQENKDEFIKQIYNELTADVLLSLYTDDDDYPQYALKTAETYDFEEAYNLFEANNLFSQYNHEKRIEFLNKSIELREDADALYKEGENRRQIALRYADLAYEYIMSDNSGDSVLNYKNAISWMLKAVQTMYNENSQEKETLREMLTNIVNYYNYLGNQLPSGEEESQKAYLLASIYESILKCEAFKTNK